MAIELNLRLSVEVEVEVEVEDELTSLPGQRGQRSPPSLPQYAMHASLLYATDALLAAIGVLLIRRILACRRPSTASEQAPLPPGPPRAPLIGNLLDVPTGRAWLGWAAHATRFGALSSLSLFGTHLVVLHDPAAAAALFEHRSAVFSDRPARRLRRRDVWLGQHPRPPALRRGLPSVQEGAPPGEQRAPPLLSQLFLFALAACKAALACKATHLLAAVIGTPAALSKFHSLIEIETRRFLLRVLDDKANLLKHIQTSAGAIIVRMAYGYTIEPTGRDPLVALADKGIAQISMAAQPGAFLVDILPFLRHIPEWIPGAGFQKTARRFRATVTELVEKPYAFVRQQIAVSAAAPSYVSALLEKFDPEGRGSLTPDEERVVKWSASSLYTGGADTTVSAIQSFFLAMLMHPHVLARAQAEVDAVTGGHGARLPTFEDRERLPYVNALVKEVLRWAPIAPMGLPHVNTEEVHYGGYRIPRGSIVMPNIWHYAHDPDVYDSPFDFRPERFLSDSERDSGVQTKAETKANGNGKSGAGSPPQRDVRDFVFGFGRRICPGKELADATLFMFIAASLAAFDMRGSEGAKAARFAFAPGTITHPENFAIDATPRSAAAEALVRAVEVEHPWDTHDAEHLAHLDWRRGLVDGSFEDGRAACV
ncbi:hypothetical protein EW145_g6967 [Phellinidium pouzarii]|uniref:Cytochrome P450 n=1 Tax=Phellinidium pouzarii TaxID=167371 RepID=A0A4S4KS20_9AGAM|nr:hypothetical protein EW145_g6967 [Phellinidium pouzarii]